MNNQAQGYNYFVPNDLIIPKDSREQELVLTDYFRLMIDNLNIKKVGDFPLTEIQNGERWFNRTFTAGIPKQYRSGFRTTLNFGTLPNAGTTSVAHNINVTSTTFFTNIYATATNPTAIAPAIKAVPIPYVNVAMPTDGIQINVDSTNVNITTTTANWTGFTECYVVLEYLQG